MRGWGGGLFERRTRRGSRERHFACCRCRGRRTAPAERRQRVAGHTGVVGKQAAAAWEKLCSGEEVERGAAGPRVAASEEEESPSSEVVEKA